MKKSLLFVLLVSGIVIGSVFAYLHFSSFYFKISTIVPPDSSVESVLSPLPIQDSQLLIPIDIPHDVLTKAVKNILDPPEGEKLIKRDVELFPEGVTSKNGQLKLGIMFKTSLLKLPVTGSFSIYSGPNLINEEWQLLPNLQPKNIEIDEVKLIELPVPRPLWKVLGIEDKPKKLLPEVSKDLNMKLKMGEIWGQLHYPYNVPDFLPTSWLIFQPQRIKVVPEMLSDLLRLYLVVGGKTEIIVGGKEPKIKSGLLPKLKLLPKRPEKDVSNLNVLAKLKWDAVNSPHIEKKLNPLLQKRLPDVVNIELMDIEITPWGDKILLMAEMKAAHNWLGSAKSKVFLAGQPKVDSGTQMLSALSLKDVEFSLETKNVLLAVVAYLWHRKIVEHIEQNSKIDLADMTGHLNQALERELASIDNDVKLHCRIAAPQLIDVKVSKKSLDAVVAASGNVSVSVTDLPF